MFVSSIQGLVFIGVLPKASLRLPRAFLSRPFGAKRAGACPSLLGEQVGPGLRFFFISLKGWHPGGKDIKAVYIGRVFLVPVK
jgi:hypothetical protein